VSLVLHHPAAASPDECARWVRGIYDARAKWTPNFEGVQFTLGRAWYTHLEEDRTDEYFAVAAESDALVEACAPGLQAKMLALLSSLVAAPVTRRDGWCGPGVHVFPAGAWVAGNGGDIHFDTEGLGEEELTARAPALSVVLMMQPPARGGGLRIWDARWDGEDSVAEPERIASRIIEYGVGDLVAFDSYRLHQIQPFVGALDRISATAHVVWTDGGWRAWF
jgi:hypothetical protein